MRFVDRSTPFIGCEQDGPVAIITLNRPDAVNAISRELEADLHSALDGADVDDTVRAIVLTGAGTRAVSAGYDMGAAAPAASTGETLRRYWEIDTR